MHEISLFFQNKKNLIAVTIMVLLILALPVGIYLVKQAQVFLPRAAVTAITVLSGDCVTTKEGKQALICGNVPLSLVSPIGPPGTAPSPTPTQSITPSPTSSISPTSSPSPSPGQGFNPDSTGNLKNSLTAYWKMDETSGNLNDVKGINNLVPSGNPGFSVPGIKNQAVNLVNNLQTNNTFFLCKNGSCTDPTKFDNTPGGGISFQAWIKPSSFAFAPANSPQSVILAHVKGNTGYTLNLGNDGKIRAEMGNSNCTNDSGFWYQDVTAPLNQWTHLVVTVSAENPGILKIYKNGQLGYTSPRQAYYCDLGGTLFVGTSADNSTPDYKFSGVIDEVGIWRKELTSQEVSDLYNSGGGNTYNTSQTLVSASFLGWLNKILTPPSVQAGDDGCDTANPSGNCPPSAIYGHVCISTDRYRTYANRGFCTTSDKPFPNKQVLLFDGSKVNIDPGSSLRDDQASYTATTSSTGGYEFPPIEPGKYRVKTTIPEGYIRLTDDSQPLDVIDKRVLWDFVLFPNSGQCSDAKDNDGDTLIDEKDPGCHTDGNPNNPASYDPADPSEGDDLKFTTCYRIAESQADLSAAVCNPYTTEPVVTNIQLKNESPGQKQIWVRFEGYLNGVPKTQDEHITIELLEKDPVISGVDCTLDLSSKNLKVTVTGERLGTEKGTVSANKTLLDITSWNNGEVISILRNPSVPVDTGQKFTIVLTTKTGKVLPEQICRVNTGLISLGARVFCREPGKFDVENVKVTLVGEDKSKVEETVTIDKDGIIGNLKTRLQAGKRYVLSIKAPYSLRRNATFTAAEGTSVVASSDSGPFILPIGDIAPAIKQDGKINTLDRSELSRQWRVLGSAKTIQTGDFNRDTKVNSIDWACMRYDFDKEDDGVPDSVSPAKPVSQASPSAASSIISPSPTVSESWATFILEGTPSVSGQEYFLQVYAQSDTDASNLFASKMTFPPDKLEVLDIRRAFLLGGTTNLTSFIQNWTEEFFDNQKGEISLVGGVPNPGFKTSGTKAYMTTIRFKVKSSPATVTLSNSSAIYKNSDNQNIFNITKGTQTFLITP